MVPKGSKGTLSGDSGPGCVLQDAVAVWMHYAGKRFPRERRVVLGCTPRVLCTRAGVAMGEGCVGSQWGRGVPRWRWGVRAPRGRGGGRGGSHPAGRALIGRAKGRVRAGPAEARRKAAGGRSRAEASHLIVHGWRPPRPQARVAPAAAAAQRRPAALIVCRGPAAAAAAAPGRPPASLAEPETAASPGRSATAGPQPPSWARPRRQTSCQACQRAREPRMGRDFRAGGGPPGCSPSDEAVSQ